MPDIEKHPFEPFLPPHANVLFLGSFPPQPKRWSIDFYYPNFINDMWRVMGLIFFGDKDRFVARGEGGELLKKFDKSAIISFCSEKGIAMYDTAVEIRRLKDNASDKFLEVVTPTDIDSLLKKIPECKAIVTTGERAAETLAGRLGCQAPKCGTFEKVVSVIGPVELWRLPSTSRAYPMALSKKAESYRSMFAEIGLI